MSVNSGHRFRDEVAEIVQRVIREMDLERSYHVEKEYLSPHGSQLREGGRRVDVAVLDRGGKPYLFLECKWQASSGSTQDKLFRALLEAQRDRLLGVHSVIVFGGEGFGTQIKRWALVEGAIHESFLELWLKEFFRG